MPRVVNNALFKNMQALSKRAFHVSPCISRGRSSFFNIHKKVTEPEKQDPDFFEKRARKLPLDDHYITALGKLYYEKIGSERDLGLKAADNLVANTETFGLPEVDKSKPRTAFKNLDELAKAPDAVKKIFSIEFGTRRDLTTEWKNLMISKVNRHSLDGESPEMKIAWMTALIRHWSQLVDEISKTTPKKPTWLTHRIWLFVNHRRKMLRILREKDAEAFDRVINELKIAYHVPKQPEHVKTRKAWAEAQLQLRVEEEKEKRLHSLHEKFIGEREGKLAKNQKRKSDLEEELKKIEQSMHNISVLEGKVTDVQGVYEPSLVGNLSETVMHSNLFYHPKPTMAKQY
ncbi:unnamed protein product [Auanema sp. JU1783]|nr:unnamed protein product [Auanema sp. JU1783]